MSLSCSARALLGGACFCWVLHHIVCLTVCLTVCVSEISIRQVRSRLCYCFKPILQNVVYCQVTCCCCCHDEENKGEDFVSRTLFI